MPERHDPARYPPLGDYALIGDCHSAALVSRSGSIDWCCMPRMDAGSLFGRLLDWDRGGSFEIALAGGGHLESRRYVDGTLVLETSLAGPGGSGTLTDCMPVTGDRGERQQAHLVRVVECTSGVLEVDALIAPRFDYGGVRPWLRRHAPQVHTAVGGDDGLVIGCDRELEPSGDHDLRASAALRAGDRMRLSLAFVRPEALDADGPPDFDPDEVDDLLDATLKWWRRWASGVEALSGPESAATKRSAIVLKALQYAPTGAIVAAPTTSLPEAPGAGRNWDYRFSWVRDSCFSVRSLAALGFDREADAFRRFIQRSAAGNAADLQVFYGIGGERRTPEVELELEGWRGARPVRVGNAASGQLQLDALGELLNLAWRWHRRGHSPDDDLWRFLLELVDSAAERWSEPDAGIWEWRGEPKHFVHSKAMCWSALDKGLALAEECMRKAPERRWRKARDEVRAAVDEDGYDTQPESFVQAFGSSELDASALLLPTIDFVEWDDERMVSTVDAVREALADERGLLSRYTADDGLEGDEGAFIACTFWLAEALARQGRLDESQEAFDRAASTSNDLGLFGEEYWSDSGETAGNFPQALTHFAHISAALALTERREALGAVSAG